MLHEALAYRRSWWGVIPCDLLCGHGRTSRATHVETFDLALLLDNGYYSV